MFTGIVTQLGKVKAIRQKPNLIILDIDVGKHAREISLGESVAVNGVCLTVTAQRGRIASFDLMRETIERTSLRILKPGSGVNLELAMRADSRFGGHFVSGHVDETGKILSIEREPNWVAMTVSISREGQKYIVPKGSVTLDGISLTVGKVQRGKFSVYLIPHTMKVTNLGTKRNGDPINIETDLLAKYILNARDGRN